MKEKDNYNIHRKFKVHKTSILGLGAKTNTLSTPHFDSLPYPTPGSGGKLFFFSLE